MPAAECWTVDLRCGVENKMILVRNVTITFKLSNVIPPVGHIYDLHFALYFCFPTKYPFLRIDKAVSRKLLNWHFSVNSSNKHLASRVVTLKRLD